MFGATGRNGGFCCLGGSKASDAYLDQKFGKPERLLYRKAEAVALVSRLLKTNQIDADRHSDGETLMAHRPKDVEAMMNEKNTIRENYGVDPVFYPKEELLQHGFGGQFHAAMTTPIGFALNPRKYADGLLDAAMGYGLKVYGHSPVIKIEKKSGSFRLTTPKAQVHAATTIVATNGYSSEDLPDWMRARYMPVQSSIVVTRPLSQDELTAQNWTGEQMAYNTHNLLHYFRLLPDQRFLFGMRGGLFATNTNIRIIKKEIRRDFQRTFPEWANVDIEHQWYGLLCRNRSRTPYVGPIHNMSGAFAGFGYHGNGVAMASYSGALLSDLVMGKTPDLPYAKPMRTVPKRFPLGSYRRHLLRPLYQWMAWRDR